MVDTSSPVDVAVCHQVLLNQRLAVLDGVDVRVVLDVRASQEGVSVLLFFRFRTFDGMGCLFFVNLKSTDCDLEQLIFPLGIQSLFVEKVFLLELVIIFFFPSLNIFILCFYFSLILKRILSH